MDLFPIYRSYIEKHPDGVPSDKPIDDNWFNLTAGKTCEKVKFDLFKRYGYIAAAGDRHLAEFCEGKWYLESPEKVDAMGFALTPVAARLQDLDIRLKKSERLLNGEEEPEIYVTGEEGVNQIRALLGLCDLVTNANIPNVGQIANLPLGAVVETNVVFRADKV